MAARCGACGCGARANFSASRGFATSGGLSKSAKVVLIREDDPVAVSNVNRNPYRTRRRLGVTRAADTARREFSSDQNPAYPRSFVCQIAHVRQSSVKN